MAFFVYILKCSDASYYVGQTDDLERRVAEHQAGEGCKYTASRIPVTLQWSQEFSTRDEAMAAELQVKTWNRAKKEALMTGRFDVLSTLASRGHEGRALRDALLRKAPQGRGETDRYSEEQSVGMHLEGHKAPQGRENYRQSEGWRKSAKDRVHEEGEARLEGRGMSSSSPES